MIIISYNSIKKEIFPECIDDIRLFSELYFNISSKKCDFMVNDEPLSTKHYELSKTNDIIVNIMDHKKDEDFLIQKVIDYQMDYIQQSDIEVELMINGYLIKVIVDTGAQKTLISYKLIKDIGLSNCIDSSYKGNIKGVGGSTKILGVIRDVEIVINRKLSVKHNIIVQDDVEGQANNLFLLGLDFMYKYKVVININDRTFTCGDCQLKFLNELQSERLRNVINVITERHIRMYRELSDSIIASGGNIYTINKMLSRILQGIINHPLEQKFRNIKKSFIDKFCLNNYLVTLGFVEKDDLLTYDISTDNLHSVYNAIGHLIDC